MGSPRVVLYIRVSSDEQAKSGYSVPDPRRALREHAAREGYEVVEEVVDDGYSGGDPHRPGLRRVLEMAASGSLDLVLATKRDRFFRSRLYRLLTEQDLKEMDVRMVSMNDTGNRLADGFQDDFAEYEREMIKERTRAGLAQKVRSGKVIPGRKPPYGFRYAGEAGERLEPHEPEMAVVRRVLDAYAGGARGGDIASGLERDGVPSPTGRSLWTKTTIRNLARSGLYRVRDAGEVAAFVTPAVAAGLDPERPYGLWSFNRLRNERRKEWDAATGDFVTHHHTSARPEEEVLYAPVDLTGSGLRRGVAEAASKSAAERFRTEPVGGRAWELKGLVRCGGCGRAVAYHGTTRKRKDGTSVRHHYYSCRARWAGTPTDCPSRKGHRAEVLEERVWRAVSSAFDPEGEWLTRLHDQYEEERTKLSGGGRRAGLLVALAKLEAKRDGHLDQQAEGLISMDRLKAKLAAIAGDEKTLREELERAGDHAKRLADLEASYREIIEMFQERFPEGAPETFATDGDTRYHDEDGTEIEIRESPEARRARYGKMGLAVVVHSDGGIVIDWGVSGSRSTRSGM